MLLVSHDPNTIKRLCKRAMLLERGQLITVGTSESVINAYHERLSQEEDDSHTKQAKIHHNDDFDVQVSIMDVHGVEHSKFVEGESLAIRVRITPKYSSPDVLIGIGIRDAMGRELGDRAIRHCALTAETPSEVVLRLVDHPLRDGLFQVDLGITEALTGRIALHMIGVASFAFFGQADESYGPIQIGGSMEFVPTLG